MTPPNQPPPQAVAELPVVATVLGAFASVAGQLGLVARAAKGAILLLVSASLLSLLLPGGGGSSFFMFLISLAAASHFGINWCRAMLLGPTGLPARSLAWRPPHWRFLGYSLLMVLIMLLVVFPMSIIGSVFASLLGLADSPDDLGAALGLTFMLVLLGMFYVLARLGFIFPAIAMEENYGLGLARQHTAGLGGLRVAAALTLAGLPLAIAQILLTAFLLQSFFGVSFSDLMPQMPQPDGSPPAIAQTMEIEPPSVVGILLFNLISAVANFLSFAVVFSVLCLAFRTCTGWVPATQNLPTAPRDDDEPGNGGATT
ncbi:MAG: hypothetical protein RH942_09045 [Kiloniellaceae bacterium]